METQNIFVLRHEHEINGYDSTIILGVYSSMTLAETAQDRFASEPGFCETSDGFIIHPCAVDQDLWSGGFVTVPVGPPTGALPNNYETVTGNTPTTVFERKPCP